MNRRFLTHGLWLTACIGAWLVGKESAISPPGNSEARTARAQSFPSTESTAPAIAKPGAQASVHPLDPAAAALLALPEYEGRSLPSVMKQILTEKDEYTRAAKFNALLSRLTAAEAGEVQQLFTENDRLGRWFIPEYNAFMHRWGQVDGPAAAKYALENYHNDHSEGLVQRMMNGWAGASPQQAVDWLNNASTAESWMQTAAMNGLVDGLAVKNLGIATQLMNEHLDDPDAKAHLVTLMDHYIQGPGMSEADRWFESLPSDGDREKLKGKIYRQLLDRHMRGGDATLDSTAEFIKSQCNQPWCQPDACSQVIQGFQKQDPGKARAWAASLPEGPMKIAAMQLAGM